MVTRLLIGVAAVLGLLVAAMPLAQSADGQAAARRVLIPIVARDAPLSPGDPRFGVAIGVSSGDDSVDNVLRRTRAGSWYYFSAGANGPEGRVQLIATGPRLPTTSDAAMQDVARARPGSWWIFGNEPNVPNQDLRADGNVAATAADYAAAYRRYRALLLAADPTARFVIGNTLNLDAECIGCLSQPSGRSFLDAFASSYRQQFGEEPPADAWGMHAYRVNWEQLPMTDAAAPQREIVAFRAWVDAQPGQRGRPIWVTELGVIWGYPRFCFEGDLVTSCGSAFAFDAVDGWLDTMLGWLRANSQALGVERWFQFTSYFERETYSTVFGGVRLMDGPSAAARLTRFGATFERHAQGG